MALTPQDGAQPRDQFPGIIGFGEIIIGAHLQANDPVNIASLRGEHQNGDFASGTYPAQDLDTALEWSEDYLLDRAAGGRADLTLLPLEQIDFFEGLPAEEMIELEKVLTRRNFARGQMLCREGDAGDRMWLIVKGSVSVRITTDAGEERRIAGLGRGTTVGEMALVESVPRSATIVADEDMVCYELSRAGFNTLLNDHPVLASRILSNLARELTRRLRRTSQDLRFSNM